MPRPQYSIKIIKGKKFLFIEADRIGMPVTRSRHTAIRSSNIGAITLAELAVKGETRASGGNG
jgi:hypothetical protein